MEAKLMSVIHSKKMQHVYWFEMTLLPKPCASCEFLLFSSFFFGNGPSPQNFFVTFKNHKVSKAGYNFDLLYDDTKILY